MKVCDILRVKGNTLFTVTPDEPLAHAINIMAEKDIGSLVVMEHGDLVGMLTFREVITAVVANSGSFGDREQGSESVSAHGPDYPRARLPGRLRAAGPAAVPRRRASRGCRP